MLFKTVNPYTNQALAEYTPFNETQTERLLEQAHHRFADWSMRPFALRADCFRSLAQVLRNRQEELAQLMTAEMGKIIAESRAEVEKCAAQCEYYAEHAEDLLHFQPVQTEARHSGFGYEPVGIVLGIMPWNFPLWQVFRYAVPALMAGNVTLLKPAPNTIGCGLAIEAAFREAGFPEGVFGCLLVDVPALKAVVEDDRLGMVTLTGSERAGTSMAALAGANIKKCVLELGGSDPLIVLADADLEAAAKAAVSSRMSNAGQVCIAAKRWIVEKSVAEPFTDRVAELIRAIRQGDPLDPAVGMGPIARLDLAEGLQKQLDKALVQGAELVVGGRREGTNMQPTLLRQVQADNIVFREETFGPLAAITTAKTAEDAIQLANDTRYGLSAAIWTTDLERANQLARQLRVGSVFINAVVRSDSRLPIGGVKKSGYGRELAEAGIREFCSVKTWYVA